MEPETPKSLGEAIEEFTDEDVPAQPTSDEETNTDVDDGEAQDEEEESEEAPASDDDDEGDDDESAFPPVDDDESDDDESDDESDDEEEAEEEEEEDMFDALTPEDMAVVKGSSELTKIRKLLLRGYNKKMEGKDQLLKLGEAYQKDPIGVLTAIAKSHDLTLGQTGTAQAKPAVPTPSDKLSKSGAKIEKLFGAAGQNVRETLEEYWGDLNAQKLGPVEAALGRVMNDNEATKMQTAENDWKDRNREVLTKKLIDEVVTLGNSGRFIPGEKVSPGDYLDDLLTIVQSKHSGDRSKEETTSASKKLARKIKSNRRNREPGGVSSKAKVEDVSRLVKDPGSFMSLGDAIEYADGELSSED
jgi:hypothetical protein